MLEQVQGCDRPEVTVRDPLNSTHKHTEPSRDIGRKLFRLEPADTALSMRHPAVSAPRPLAFSEMTLKYLGPFGKDLPNLLNIHRLD